MANVKMNSPEANKVKLKITKAKLLLKRTESWKNDKELLPEAYLSIIKEVETRLFEAKQLLQKLML